MAVLGWVDGHGTTLEAQSYIYRDAGLQPGRYVFRLKQIDYDGTFDISPEVEVRIEMPAGFHIDPPYPNPFNLEATLHFVVSLSQQVQVELYDVMGRRLKVIYAGTPPAGQAQTVRIEGSGLPNGMYLVRVAGKTFVHTQLVALAK